MIRRLRNPPETIRSGDRAVEYVNPNIESVDTTDEADLVVEDLVEDVSIDGMCGVY
jgi:mycofactocin precursor